MKRSLTCIICPNGCEIEAEYTEGSGEISLAGAACKRGEEYVRQELIAPKRTISSSVSLLRGELPLASVRLDEPVDRALIPDMMREILSVQVEAPVKIGQIVLENVLGTGSNVIITKNIPRAADGQKD